MPTKRLLIVFLITSLLLISIGAVSEISWVYIFSMNIIIFLASFIDLFFSPRKHQLTFQRILPEEMERGLLYTVEVEVNNRSTYSIAYSFIDGLPPSFQRPFPWKGTAFKQSATKVTYETSASIRGKYAMNKLYFRYKSFAGLWEKQMTIEWDQQVKVIPDLTDTKQYLENAQKFLLYEGLKIRKQQRGVGDFSQIRSYVVGDDPRMINWRQTAKLREVMTNEYEPEHGKHITILIDCGRMMGAELTKGNRLEKVLEAALTVAAAALQKGDYVSVLAFSKEVKMFVPSAKGMAHLQTIIRAIYDLEVDPVESNYAAVLSFLEIKQKKRSLLLLFSDVRTFLHEESALTYLLRLRQRHLFFMIGIEDVTIVKRIKEKPESVQNTMVKSIAQQQMLLKKREKLKWERQGLLMIEAREESLATAAVSHYIDIMNRNLI
ncbi:DUF58 domain-containing protein [Bacillus sp. FJAT-50079]|nr:DUF58 domain-containing protein [Bacillus sp. FJAT-50079]